jgi:ketosteroid isomerase-like protein
MEISAPWTALTRLAAFAFAILFMLGTSGRAQAPSADERQIRDLIERYGKGESIPRTADVIFWSGAFKRPIVGSERGEEISSDRQPSARIPGSERNKTTPVRIEIAKSGDLAYEFSHSTLSFDLKSGGKESFPTSVLRVWKKEDGQWKIAAMFARPHYQDP